MKEENYQKLEDLWSEYIGGVPNKSMASARSVFLAGCRAGLSVVKSNGFACTRNQMQDMEKISQDNPVCQLRKQ